MNSAINYLLESGISLSVFATVYVLFLRKETFFRLNRLFLLGSLFFSVVLPIVKISVLPAQPVTLSEVTVTPYRNLLEVVTVYGQDLTTTVEAAVSSVHFLIWLYLLGLMLFLIRFIIRLVKVWSIIRKNPVIKYNGFNIVMLERECSPFSFLNYVFVDKNLQGTGNFDRMLSHELEHIHQGHTYDVLILEVLTAFQWFNPFVWLLYRAIRENHEFLADRAVLASGISRGNYKKLLLEQFTGGQLVLTNNFNYSLITKRIKMMSKIRSSKAASVKLFAGLLAAVALIIAFACEQKEIDELAEVDDTSALLISRLDESSLKIEGDESSLKHLVNIMSDSREFEVSTIEPDVVVLKKKITLPKILKTGEEVFNIVENMPQFPGGEFAFRKFIADNISYPVTAQKNGIQGRVYVTFVVDKEGNTANAKIAKGVDPLLDMEALRVVNSLPAWIPGTQKGKPVNVNYTVPINFSLQ